MRSFYIFIVSLSLMTFFSCSKPKSAPGSLKLKFNPMFGSNQMRMDSTYLAPDGRYYYFSDFRLYLSHIKFVRADGSSVEVSPLIFIGLNDTTGTQPTFTLNNPTGIFSSIQFSIGLDSAQDNSFPSTDAGSPLYSDNNMYWNSTIQYVFVILEGFADTVNPPLKSIGYHIGTAPYYRTVTLNKTFSTSVSAQTILVLNADIQKLFWGTNAINILNPSETLTNTTTNPLLANKFINDFTTVFSIY
jgi:hypothetical protein